MRRAHVRSLALLAVFGVLWWTARGLERAAPARPADAPDRPAAEAPTAGAAGADGGSPLARGLHTAGGDGHGDARIVLDLLRAYRGRFGVFPTGEDNAAIVRALTGSNEAGLVILPRGHAALSPSGELLDRWGMPFFFHLISRDHVEVRSAGPDRELHTADDILESSRPS